MPREKKRKQKKKERKKERKKKRRDEESEALANALSISNCFSFLLEGARVFLVPPRAREKEYPAIFPPAIHLNFSSSFLCSISPRLPATPRPLSFSPFVPPPFVE